MKSIPLFSVGLSLKNKDVTTQNQGAINSKRPLHVMVTKEITDHIRSWRFVVLLLLIVFTFFGALYVSLSHIKTAVSNTQDPDRLWVYLKLLTITDGTLPPFHVFLTFLGPLLGISLGFDSINSEQNNGTLTRLMAQPVYRDNVLLSKFLSAILLVSCLFVSLALLLIGAGLIITGVAIEPQEVLRIFSFILLTILYMGFWLSLSILLSIRFRQPATSALTAIAIWLFFTVFYNITTHIAARSLLPDPRTMTAEQVISYNNTMLHVQRLEPSQLYADATTTLLMPSVRSLGPLTMEQMAAAIPAPLPFLESLLIVWPQISGLLSATLLCFALSYYLFMRREIRS